MPFYNFYILHFILLFYFCSKVLSSPNCKDSENFCNKCNPLTNLCIKCQYDFLIPDNNGGCVGKEKCSLGKNYCNECDIEGKLCAICERGYYPDKNGGCAYTENCLLSNKGKCIECEKDFILVGKELDLKICKYLNQDDFKNCIEIDNENGVCKTCEDGYFLNTGDNKCTKTENCHESIFGNCIACYIGLYLNKKNNTCLLKINNFLYCKQSFDGEKCEICDELSYFDEKGDCALSNYCSESLNGKCQKCIENYYLSSLNFACSTEKYCSHADEDTGLCIICETNYYLDTKDYKCKSNKEENEFKYCQKVNEGICIECIKGYRLSRDFKCTLSYNCLEAENGNCILCEVNYFLGLDYKCTNVEHCIYSKDDGSCFECEDNYYYNTLNKNCTDAIGNFENCKISAGFYCSECKDNFYLNKNDSTCIDNTQEGPFYKCQLSDPNNEFCVECIDGYYLGSGDNKCSLISECKKSQDENTCIECEDYFCLDLKNGTCVDNDFIYDENIKFYFACSVTNKEGTGCDKCIDGYEIGKDGYCVDASRCLEEKDGECIRCTDEESINGYSYCANKVFGYVESIQDGCLRCDDLLDLYYCTECKEGYTPFIYGACRKNPEN